ncbi:DUF3842 family protein [Desulfoluna butyratoxydans]|uniref:DUF3842 family protein n=1 Tax=Desulfoluna butyratoxydans TaxID=231438 RepID=A0A4U8YR31_9BACT|nr:DUF3842 family protein [Desulfoluna butyratoxydans]VFQ43703.1 protein of unknown function duf3842 [Desulfoluna butyratoxydans]
MLRICVIDGQGGGIGSAIIRRIKDLFAEKVEIIALGTNAVATAQMLKAGANRGASGENAIVRSVQHCDVATGPLGIVMAHALMGEVTPAMAEAISGCAARKVLLPLSQDNVEVVGVHKAPLPHLVDELIESGLKTLLN